MAKSLVEKFRKLDAFAESQSGQRVIRKLNILLLVASVALLLMLGCLYGTRYNIAWLDESLFVDISQEFVSHGVLGAPSYQGNGLHMAEKTYFMPPLYPLMLAFWFELFPATLQSARIFSGCLAAGCLILVFLLGQSLCKNSVIVGLMVVGLALDVQFASMFSWARPDMLALTLSLLAIYIYYHRAVQKSGGSLAALACAWVIASAAMLTHPIGGMIGFLTIFAHFVIVKPQELRNLRTWMIFLFIPILAVSLWGAYIVQDLAAFRLQFIDWQSARKASRFDGLPAYIRMFADTILNDGIKGTGLLAGVSTGIVILLALKARGEDASNRPALLLLLLVIFSGLAVNYGREMAYPPLRLPAFYLSLFFCVEPLSKVLASRRFASVNKGLFTINYSLVMAFLLLLIVGKSAFASWALVREVRFSDRACSYDPVTLVNRIIANTDGNKSLAIQIFPDGYDLLLASKHFKSIRQLSWQHLSDSNLVRHVCLNDYLVITDTVMEPRDSGRLINFTDPVWGGKTYRRIAERFYTVKEVIELPGGGVSRLYQRNRSGEPRVESIEPK